MHPTRQPCLSATDGGPWQVCGKTFRDAAGHKVFLNGVAYGPFEPMAGRGPWPEESRLRDDFASMARMGFNAVRIYEPPTAAVLALADDHGLRLLCGVPWTQHVDFLADSQAAADAVRRVREAARTLGRSPTVAALIVGNEIEKTLVRWMGPEKVRAFLEHLIDVAHEEAPTLAVSYATYPSTEYLVPRNADFVSFNVFLEHPDTFAAYLQHLQNIAGDKPLLITEFGLDVRTHGPEQQRAALKWQRESLLRGGAAGGVWFSFTDEWHRGGAEVTDWAFGLVTADRQWRLAASAAAALPKSVGDLAHDTPLFFSVVVCTRNGASTLRSCLEALGRQTWPHYEVLVIDDGSTDATAEIVLAFPSVCYHRQNHAGLSVARNLGLSLARGEVIAYTDDDCLPDEDWLLHLATAYDDPGWVAAGGPNIPPPPRNNVEAVVGLAPGAPAQVLLADAEAEHLPGCNLSIRKSALLAIGGFRAEFRAAGDDVDVCWRLQSAGGRLRYVPGAVVWHHRRATVGAYLRQQRGYGDAEALLVSRFPQRFAWLGGAQWSGAIYGSRPTDDLRSVEFGKQGLAAFQCVYERAASGPRMTGLLWLCASALLLIAGLALGLAAATVAGVTLLAMTWIAAWREATGRLIVSRHSRPSQRGLLALLCWLQPIVRDVARLRGLLHYQARPRGASSWTWSKHTESPLHPRAHWSRRDFWSESSVSRVDLLQSLALLAAEHGVTWREASAQDICDGIADIHGLRFGLLSVTEYHESARMLTAVRFGQLPQASQRWVLALAGGTLLLAWWLGWPQVVILCMGAVLVAIGTLALARELRARRIIHGLIMAAASDCGLSVLGASLRSASDEDRHPALAEMPEPAKIILDES